jgi:hypothetical protein
MEASFESDLEKSAEITPPEWSARGSLHRLGDWAAHLLAPVL